MTYVLNKVFAQAAFVLFLLFFLLSFFFLKKKLFLSVKQSRVENVEKCMVYSFRGIGDVIHHFGPAHRILFYVIATSSSCRDWFYQDSL